MNGLKLLFGALSILGGILSLSFVASYIGYQAADHMYYEQIAGIIGKVVKEYPESEVLLVKGLKQLEEKDVVFGEKILKNYGYTGEFLQLSHNKRGFNSVLKTNMVFASVTFFLIGSVVYGMYRWIKKKLDHLQGYLIQIAKGDYRLNIEGVGEGKLSVFEDEIYKTTLALRESKEEQEKEKLNLARNIADISHQLKTPLTSMGIMTDLLLENEVDEDNKRFIEKLNKQIERLSCLVAVLLKLAKFDAGTVNLKAQEIGMIDFVEEIVEVLEAPIHQKKIQIKIDGLESASFIGDRNWTYEALHNILNNCIQHSPLEGRITIVCSQNPIYEEIVIEDEGGGILSEDLPHIFDRFYKGKNASKESIGIGLAMAKTIIEKQSGEIRVHNVGKGAQFQIKFYRIT